MMKHIRLYASLAIALICSSLAAYGATTTKYTLTSLSPTQVVAGTSNFVLTLNGSQFKKGMQVQFGSALLTPSYLDSKVMRVTVPSSAIATAGYVSVKAVLLGAQGGESNALSFLVMNPVPSISEIRPSSVTVIVSTEQHTLITILGSNFVSNAKVNVEGSEVPAYLIKPDEITVDLPAAYLDEAGKLPISVTNPAPGGGTSKAVNLIVRGRIPASWRTVANNNTVIPGTQSPTNFNSYNQPSVNEHGLVVFKGQSKGQSGPTVGIYTRDMSSNQPGDIVKMADNSTSVPAPNNLSATFIQFPSFPRIDKDSSTIAFRGQSQPVWQYSVNETDTRIGTTGVFANPAGALATGVNLLGAVSGFEYFQVPGAPQGTRFDQFPGSPAVTDNSMIVFKGNYTVDNVGKTGVFYRDISLPDGKASVELIANSGTVIPGQSEGGTAVFGSTAPPSAANGNVVFVGLDNEDSPTMGGIYFARLSPSPTLETLVSIGSQVPEENPGTTFNRLSEGLSFDGRYVAFWGAWGTGMKTRLLKCQTDGNASVIAACNSTYPNGYRAKIPVHQGLFVYDLLTRTMSTITKTPGEFDDFVYWVFSGRPPSTGGSDGDDEAEPPRWRSSSFVAVAGHAADRFSVTFKAWIGSTDGIYQAQGPGPTPILTVVDTATPGTSIDPEAPAGSSLVTVGMERDSLRGDWLVITSSMLDTVTLESNAGVYITPITAQ